MCDGNAELRNEVLQERLLCEQKALEFTARKVLHMVLSSFSTDRCALEQVTIANLMAVRWHPPFDASAQKCNGNRQVHHRPSGLQTSWPRPIFSICFFVLEFHDGS